MTKASLLFLGTGDAVVTKCYNTCFILRQDDDHLLVDAGGGNGVLRQLELAGVSLARIHDLFLTHAHTDHLMGAVWVVRLAIQLMQRGLYDGVLRVWSHEKCLRVLEFMCRQMLSPKMSALLGERVEFREVQSGDAFTVGRLECRCFDILSTKERQFGFSARLADGQRLVCLGDEPFNESNRDLVAGADWLLSEAFCLYRDREEFRPYEKHHSTALDAGRVAQSLGVRHLVLYHTEDHHLLTRKADYAAEAAQVFEGPIEVPDDLEVIALN